MTIFSSSGSASEGSLGASSLFSIPPLPTIIAEWASLIPLTCHIATPRFDHQIVGEIALLGRLSFGVFPKLGVLNGCSKLLSQSPGFLDEASSRGKASCKVFDVRWGSVFTSSNGAATAMITQFVLDTSQSHIRMPDCIQDLQNQSTDSVHKAEKPSGGRDCDKCGEIEVSTTEPSPSSLSSAAIPTSFKENPAYSSSTVAKFRRPQVLHVLQFSRKSTVPSFCQKLRTLASSAPVQFLYFLSLLAIAVVLILYDAYGSATILLSGIVSELAGYLVRVQRPSGYLENNENHDACMLASIHENASIWYLYTGDRGIVDTVLNKTMIEIPHSKILSCWFKVAHMVQLSAVTFVTAQKGWDGVYLTVLVILATFSGWRPRSLVRRWLDASDMEIQSRTFEFSGRTPLVGAIQIFSGSKMTAWMDQILVPCGRRELWLSRLASLSGDQDGNENNTGVRYTGLSKFDQTWVDMNFKLAIEAVKVLKRELEVIARVRG